jgi:hypothetical protein
LHSPIELFTMCSAETHPHWLPLPVFATVVQNAPLVAIDQWQWWPLAQAATSPQVHAHTQAYAQALGVAPAPGA